MTFVASISINLSSTICSRYYHNCPIGNGICRIGARSVYNIIIRNSYKSDRDQTRRAAVRSDEWTFILKSKTKYCAPGSKIRFNIDNIIFQSVPLLFLSNNQFYVTINILNECNTIAALELLLCVIVLEIHYFSIAVTRQCDDDIFLRIYTKNMKYVNFVYFLFVYVLIMLV